MTRLLSTLILAGLANGLPAAAADGSRDPAFDKLPFDQWMSGGTQGQFHWSAKAQPVVLSVHQRLLARVDVTLDGLELARRRGRGELLILFQITDRDGRVYQDHSSIDLAKVEVGVKSEDIVYTESAFALPGDYGVSIAIFDTATNEHAVRRETLHVSPMKGDPLPQAWRDLPPIEFRPPEKTPDSWYLPSVRARLHLPVETRRPVRLDVLVNLTPSERATGSQRAQDWNLGVLLPTLKALSQMELRAGSLNIESLDLTRQKVAFHQDGVRELDWSTMRDSLTGDSAGTIDVKSLGDREHSAAFFVNEVRKRVAEANVMIVLSGSVAFEQRVDLAPIHPEEKSACRVYYIRYHPAPVHLIAQPQQMIGRRYPMARNAPMQQRQQPARPVIDQLEPTLKPLNPRLFDVETPEQVRKALATIIAEIE